MAHYILQNLTKIRRHGSILEVAKYSKPYFPPPRKTNFSKRPKSTSTFKTKQNIWRAKTRIRRNVHVGIYLKGNPAFATFTYANQQQDAKIALRDWSRFTERMKKTYPDVAFMRVPERHKKGGIHFHAVMFGLPPEVIPCRWNWVAGKYRHACGWNVRCEMKERRLAKVWGLGAVDLQKVRKPHAIGNYIAGYLTKGDPDWTLFGVHLASSNQPMRSLLIRGRVLGVNNEFSTTSMPDTVKEYLDDSLPFTVPKRYSEFDTLWLGKCCYSVYEIHKTVLEIRRERGSG